MLGTVIKVGSGGRGFIIETDEARYVVTAAHCLDELPPAHAAGSIEERTAPTLSARSTDHKRSLPNAYSPIRSLILRCFLSRQSGAS
jgi:hypothetical protein